MHRRFESLVAGSVALAVLGLPLPLRAAERTVELRSNGDYASVPLPEGTREVEIVEQRAGACRFNRSWGYDLGNRELWVNGGCGGLFRISGDLRADDKNSSNVGAAVAAALAVAGIAILASRQGDKDRPSYPPERPDRPDRPGRPDPTPPDGRPGSLRGANGLCLDMRGREVAQGTEAIVERCNGGRNQRFVYAGNGELRSGSLCLDIADGSNDNGARLIAWPCNGQTNQRWHFSGATIRSAMNGRCIDIFQGAARAGQPVVVWDCNGRANQRWWW